MDEVQITLAENRQLADEEKIISHLQVEVEHHKKMLWNFKSALKKEEDNLKNLQTEFGKFKNQWSYRNENH